MKHSALPLLAAASLLLTAMAAAATRPHYGGTLRLSLLAAPASLDPADSNQPESITWRNITGLVFDTLVVLDNRGQPQPELATSWQSESSGQRWQFHLRGGVRFADGAPLTSDAVAASLRVANPGWRVFSAGDAVVIECEAPDAKLPTELALPRYGVARREGRKLAGSGPFAISRWEAGKKLTLVARDDYWGGRAFVDSVEIELGKSLREQMIALDLNQAEIIEVAPEQARRSSAENRRIETSSPVELMALVFARDPQSAGEKQLREALALSVDRGSMNEVLLQRGGEPAGGLLPNWITGYAFLFRTEAELPRARQLRNEVQVAPPWSLGYDAADPLARVIAERIVLNARDAGITLQLVSSSAADVRIGRLPLTSLDPQISLATLAAKVGLAQPKPVGNSSSDLYTAENGLLQTQRIIPLLYLRAACGVGPSVRNWSEGPDGSWQLDDAWLSAEKR